MHVHELHDFAGSDRICRIGKYAHDAHVANINHHLEGPRVEKVADQHAGLVAEHGVSGVHATASLRRIDNVVVQQRCRVNEFDYRRGAYMLLTLVAQRPCRQ